MKPGGARAPLRWLRPLLAGGALALLGAGHTPAFAAALPTGAPAAVPTVPPVALPTAPPVTLPPVDVPAPPVNVPPPPVNVPPPPPVNVPPPPVNVPTPPQQPLPTAVSVPPVPTPNVALPSAPPAPSLPNPAGGAALPGVSGTPAAAGAAGPPALPGAASGALPSGVTASGVPVDPSSGAASSASQSPLALGEHDYSSAGSPAASTAVGSATVQGARASQTGSPAQSVPMICPQLAFAPLVSGCESVLGPLNGPVGEKLAHTGTPIAIGAAGLFFIGLGTVLYRRSSRREDGSATSRPRRLETR